MSSGQTPEKVYITRERYTAVTLKLLRDIRASGFRPKQIVAILRGGYPPADAASRFFDGVPIAVLPVSSYPGTATSPGKIRIGTLATLDGLLCEDVLVFDDLTDTGGTFRAVIDHLATHHGVDHRTVRTAVLFHKKRTSIFVPTYYGEVIEGDPPPWLVQPQDVEFGKSVAEPVYT